jgi:hypothetical protein
LLIQLTLSKLSDPEKTLKKENATVHHLVKEIEKLNTPELTAKIQPLYKSLSDGCKPVRELRNKVIAHLDRDIALRKATIPAVAAAGQIGGR